MNGENNIDRIEPNFPYGACKWRPRSEFELHYGLGDVGDGYFGPPGPNQISEKMGKAKCGRYRKHSAETWISDLLLAEAKAV